MTDRWDDLRAVVADDLASEQRCLATTFSTRLIADLLAERDALAAEVAELRAIKAAAKEVVDEWDQREIGAYDPILYDLRQQQLRAALAATTPEEATDER